VDPGLIQQDFGGCCRRTGAVGLVSAIGKNPEAKPQAFLLCATFSVSKKGCCAVAPPRALFIISSSISQSLLMKKALLADYCLWNIPGFMFAFIYVR